MCDHNSPIGSAKEIDRGNWTDLPNVEYEIRLIEDKLSGQNNTILIDDDATEPALNSLSKDKITTLHISTHGFYRDNAGLTEAAKNPENVDYNIARRFISAGISEISGLVLREGNLSWKSRYILEEHDDLLTDNDIELLSFPNLNLTVLSAFDTGLGEIDSDGVWGLQRAFRITGAKSLICSLAKVDDYWTAQFMDAFYEQAAQGKSIYDSFHIAQRWLRKELPDNSEIWSSFILIE
ncbi:MAG: CHAT domain-containing protein [Muribaculaceae bacterium]|nr:CHAT domain-containing protein [Muribaculaceae bacterium]